MNEGWIIYNGSLPDPRFRYMAEMLAQAAVRVGLRVRIVKNNDVAACIDGGQARLLGSASASLPRFVIMYDKDVLLARHLEVLGVRSFNAADVIENCDDKRRTHQVLAGHGIPMPRTILAPLVYNEPLDSGSILAVVCDELGFPMIIKEAFGSFGQQVYLINDPKELKACLMAMGNKPFLFQEYISESHGVDIRLHVVGQTVVAAMKRRSTSDFRANVSTGASMEKYSPSGEEIALAVKACQVLKADFAGVDLLLGPDGPLLCEVNSNAHLKNILDCTGVNVALHIVEHIKNEMGL